MKINTGVIGLIESFEGCRTDAYRDCVGIWTIGYGHTSSAGPPTVTPGMTISKQEARALLETDVGNFSKGVQACLQVQLDDNQFSALVSFAYNIGLAEFCKSSVLRAVNAGQFAAVPALMALWIKAGGRVVPGLVARRAAEAALFCKADDDEAQVSTGFAITPVQDDIGETPENGSRVEPVMRNLGSNTSVAAALGSAGGGVLASAARHLEVFIGKHLSFVLEIAAVAVILSCAAWLLYDNRSKSTRLTA